MDVKNFWKKITQKFNRKSKCNGCESLLEELIDANKHAHLLGVSNKKSLGKIEALKKRVYNLKVENRALKKEISLKAKKQRRIKSDS